MILDLDAGNTRVKWRLSAPGREKNVAWGACTYRIGLSVPFLPAVPVDRIRISSVLAGEREREFLLGLDKMFGVSPEIATTSRNALGVTNSYRDVTRMGVDRWLAMVAAYGETATATCVVDVGTTMTVDCLAEDGRHMGGYIVPGLEMIEQAVFGGTDRVSNASGLARRKPVPGCSTEAAVLNGSLSLLFGLVTRARQWLEREIGHPARVIVTGGCGFCLLEHAEIGAEYRRDLVLDGLALLLP